MGKGRRASVAFGLTLIACTTPEPPSPPAATVPASPEAGLPAPPVQAALRAAISPSLTDYFVYRGRPRGFEYDLLNRLARRLDRRLSLEVVDDPREASVMLERRDIDLWIPTSPWRPTGGGWSPAPPYAHADTVVVVRRGQRPERVMVRRGSFALDDLTAWCTPPCEQQPVDAVSDWALLKRLQQAADPGLAVAVDRRHGTALSRVDPRFEVVHGMGSSRPVRWWVHRADPELTGAVVRFFNAQPERRMAALEARYFDNPFQMRLRARPAVRSDIAKRITRWDPALRRAQTRYNIDWRLLAAVMMVESAQDPGALSSVGAQGLFQFMPKTAAAMGLTDPSDPNQSSLAAARYLRRLIGTFAKASSPYDQQMMALAAYNVGHAHVQDAVVLADQLGLDSTRWDEGVSLTLPLLAKDEFAREARHGRCQGLIATRYAEQVSDLYEQYSQLLSPSLVDRDGGPEKP